MVICSVWLTYAQCKNEDEFHDTEASCKSDGRESSCPDPPFVVVVECLAPCDEGETGESLRLELEGEVEVLITRK